MSSWIVVKLGGSILNRSDDSGVKNFLRTLVRHLKNHPAVIVHGGGPLINQYLQQLNITPKFIQGLRYTDERTLTVVRFVLNGLVNPRLTFLFNQVGRKAIGISGETGLVSARRQKQLGFVGEPEKINSDLLKKIWKTGLTPVISCLGRSKDGKILNINADTLARFIAAKLLAKELILFTDVCGVLDSNRKTIPVVRLKEISRLIREGIITGGMIPKILAARQAVLAGVKNIVIVSPDYGFQKNKYTVIKK